MKKIFFCSLITVISFVSYVQGQDAYLVNSSKKYLDEKVSTQREDTIYLKYKNVNYMLRKSPFPELGTVTNYMKNIDAKYPYDEKTRYKSNPEGLERKDIKDYYYRTRDTMGKDVYAIFFKYIKENLAISEQKRLLDFAKKYAVVQDLLTLRVLLERDSSFFEISWSYDSDILDILSHEDVAELDMLIRKNIVVEKSGLDSQRPLWLTFSLSKEKVAEFLEKELKGK